MGDGQQANNPGYKISWSYHKSVLGYVTVSNADAKELGMSNEIVANGGLTEVMLQLQLKTES
jgi:molybdopterin-containing oxidoreductase family iron-sulfur binding subunit